MARARHPSAERYKTCHHVYRCMPTFIFSRLFERNSNKRFVLTPDMDRHVFFAFQAFDTQYFTPTPTKSKQKIRKLSEEQPSTFTVNIDLHYSLVDIIITLVSIANASVSNNQCQHLIPSLGANMRCICSHADDIRVATSLSDACAVLSPRAKRSVENLHTEKMILDKTGLPWFDLSLFYAK